MDSSGLVSRPEVKGVVSLHDRFFHFRDIVVNTVSRPEIPFCGFRDGLRDGVAMIRWSKEFAICLVRQVASRKMMTLRPPGSPARTFLPSFTVSTLFQGTSSSSPAFLHIYTSTKTVNRVSA